jgi:hypothetical protein
MLSRKNMSNVKVNEQLLLTALGLNMFDDLSTNFIERFFEIVSYAKNMRKQSPCGQRLIDGIRHDRNNEKRERNRNGLEMNWKRTATRDLRLRRMGNEEQAGLGRLGSRSMHQKMFGNGKRR